VQYLPRQAPFFQGAGSEVLTQHVRLFDQLLEDLDPLGTVQIDGDGFLVARFAKPSQGVSALGRRAILPTNVTADGMFHLEYFGPELAEDAGAIRCCDHCSHIDDPNTRKGQRILMCCISHDPAPG